MITRALIKALDYADSPRAVSFTTSALERVTGARLVQYKNQSVAVIGAAEWYQREGFYGLAAKHGFGGGSYSGKNVTPATAIESSALLAIVKIISEDIASLPFFLHERDKTGESVNKAYGNSLYRVLHDAPNSDMSSGEFREALTARALMGLDGYAKIIRSKEAKQGVNQVIALYPLIDQQVRMDRNKSNQLIYLVKDGNSPEETYTADQIFHLKGWTLNGQKGEDILKCLRHAIGLGLSADEYAGRFFANDASPGLIMEVPSGVPPYGPTKIKEIKDAWRKWHQGTDRAHEPAIIQDGVKLTRNDPDHQKLQLLESRRFQIVEIARPYRMPLHMLADLERSTDNNIEQQALEYVQRCLGPWRRRWEDAAHRCLLTRDEQYWPSGRPRMFAEFNVESMVRGDFATQTAGWSTLLQNGVYCIDDVLGFLNLNPLPNGIGKIHRVQLNMQDVQQAAKQAIAA